MKPSHIVIAFVIGIAALVYLPKSESNGAPKPEPVKKQPAPKLELKVTQSASCEDLAAVETRVSKLEATVRELQRAKSEAKSAPVKLIPTMPVKQPAPAKSTSTKQSAMGGNCSSGQCYPPSFSGRGRRGRW